MPNSRAILAANVGLALPVKIVNPLFTLPPAARGAMVAVLHDAKARGDCLDSHQFGTRAGAIPPSIAGSIESSSQPTPARTYGHQCGLVRREGQLVLTPLALALIMIESSELIFALDSIPAIFPITCDSFLGFTSNIVALLSLRSLYFALALQLLF